VVGESVRERESPRLLGPRPLGRGDEFVGLVADTGLLGGREEVPRAQGVRVHSLALQQVGESSLHVLPVYGESDQRSVEVVDDRVQLAGVVSGHDSR
jgi:hypothetical protein